MKIIKSLFLLAMLTLVVASCEKELDPIIPVDPKPDQTAPTVAISYPIEGKAFVSPDEPATITFKVLAVDDVELQSVTLKLNGAEIVTFNSFLDYRRADIKYNYSGMIAGTYTLSVDVVDLTGKTASTSVNFNKVTAPVYEPLAGEVLYFPLDGFNLDLVTGAELTVNGAPGYAAGKLNDCYAGATDAYLTYPADAITSGTEFSVAFWYKINADPLRAGILAISPEGDSRNSGFRLFRENSGANQNIGLNIGIGTTEVWMNPFVAVPADQDWMHIAIVISTSKATIYVNGEIAPTNSEVDLESKIDWTGCSSMTIASGMPNFVYWEHFSDLSLYDEMHFFTKALTPAEVLDLYAVKK